MISIPKNIVLQRWDALPDNLKEALTSEENSSFLERLGKSENLPADKYKLFLKLSGYVMLGFIHPDDLGKELQESSHIPLQTAKNLETALKEKVFNLYAEDLKKIYRPAEKVVPPTLTTQVPAKSLSNQPAPAPLPPAPPAPKKEFKIPVNGGVPKPVNPSPVANIPKPAGTPIPPAPAPAAASSPFIIHNKGEVRPVVPPPDFRLGGIPRPNASNVSIPPPMQRAAKVEMGNIKMAVGQIPQPPKPGAREPIHYAQPKSMFMPQIGFSTPVVSDPGTNNGKVEIPKPNQVPSPQFSTTPVSKPVQFPAPSPVPQTSIKPLQPTT